MDYGWNSRKFRLITAATVILLALTMYFCWEILYQERVILNLLRMSKDSDKDADRVEKALNSDHLEDVVEAWFDLKKKEVLDDLRKGGADASKQLKLSKEDLVSEMNKKLGTELSQHNAHSRKDDN